MAPYWCLNLMSNVKTKTVHVIIGCCEIMSIKDLKCLRTIFEIQVGYSVLFCLTRMLLVYPHQRLLGHMSHAMFFFSF